MSNIRKRQKHGRFAYSVFIFAFGNTKFSDTTSKCEIPFLII